VNGFLASTEAEWIDKLDRLLGDADLRGRLGRAGRETIDRQYSLHVHAPLFAETLGRVVDESHAR
jgi:hypothetical protein